MTLQKIKALDGKDEYVLLPIAVFRALRGQIERCLAGGRLAKSSDDDFVPFVLEDYVDNPVALARIKAKITQAELARRLEVSQAYVSKIEAQEQVSSKVLAKVGAALSHTTIARPAVTLPTEMYTPERVREFDAAEQELAAYHDTRAPTVKRARRPKRKPVR